MKVLALALIGLLVAVAPPRLAPTALICVSGRITWLSGTGAPRTPLLIIFAGRPVGGGSVNAAGFWSLPLHVGSERPGLYPIEVRSRNDRAIVGAFTCAVGVALPTPVPAAPTAIQVRVTPTDTATSAPTPVGAAPIGDGDCPDDHLVKGNIVGRGETPGEKIYHLPGGSSYAATDPERCFVDAAEAEAAGYRPVK